MLLNKPKRKIKLMEICGTHTMSIAQNGIRSLLEENIELVSGPGCPVCVTPSNIIDICLELLKEPNIVIFSYGDMLRVPGSKGKRLFQHKQVRMCLSPLEALDYAKENPNKQIIFLGVGFETTTPGSAICILEAYKQNIKNFFFYSLLKRTKPALRTLLKDDPDIDGFICPGHVACILGEQGFQFLSKEYHKPGVISGFEAEDILCSINLLIDMINQDTPAIKNTYQRAVRYNGNQKALSLIHDVFEPETSLWKGLGNIEKSGLKLKDTYSQFDAKIHFQLPLPENKEPKGCQCANILTGKKKPIECPLFQKICTPQNPIGPCMVSSEGACAASFMYEERL